MTIEQKAKWFDAAIRFVIEEPVHLVMKSRIEGKSNWAIVDTKLNKVLNSNMEWEDEPPLSKREESFLIRSRFSFEQAVQLYQQLKMFSE